MMFTLKSIDVPVTFFPRAKDDKRPIAEKPTFKLGTMTRQNGISLEVYLSPNGNALELHPLFGEGKLIIDIGIPFEEICRFTFDSTTTGNPA